TMVFVSHSIGQMKRFCSKILWLEFGQVKEYGDMEKVIPNYEAFLSKWEKMTKKERASYKHAALNNDKDISKIDIDDYFVPNPNYNKVIEKPVSKLAHFKGIESFLMSYPNKSDKVTTKNYKDTVYYIKKEARYQDEVYNLLSTERSSLQGVIGWVQSKYLVMHTHVLIDNDIKEKTLTGKGKGYTDPWGGRKQIIINDLTAYTDQVIQVF